MIGINILEEFMKFVRLHEDTASSLETDVVVRQLNRNQPSICTLFHSIVENWHNLNLSAFCDLIIEWKSESIRLDNNRHTNIIKDIQNIKFIKLNELYIRYNNIESIEAIQSIYMPNVQKLSLSENSLIDLSSLRKGHWKNLAELYLCN